MKRYIIAAAALMMIAAAFVVTDLEENDAATEYAVTVYYNENATIYMDSQQSANIVTSPSDAREYTYGGEVVLIAVIDDGYTFDHWYGNNITEGEDWTVDSTDSSITISGQTVRLDTYCYGETEYTLYLSGDVQDLTLIFDVSSDYSYGNAYYDGSYSNTLILIVPYGAYWYTSGDSFFVDGMEITAVPFPDTAQYDYSFLNWSRTGSGTITTDNDTITLYFERNVQQYDITIQSNNTDYGTVSTSSLSVSYGASITSSGTTLTVGGNTVTASPNTDSDYYSYAFSSWSTSSGTVTGDLTITATFTRAVNDFAVTVMYNSNATIYVDTSSQTVTSPNSAWEYPYLTEISIVAVMDDGYTFNYWYGNNITEGEDYTITSSDADITISDQTVTWSTVVYGEEEYTLYLNGPSSTTYTLTFAVSPEGYGSVSESSVTVSEGTQCVVSDNYIYLNDGDTTTTVTATAAADTLEYTYAFDSWSRSGTTTISEDTTITAYFTRESIVIEEGTYWTNDMYNGSIDILFQFSDSTNMDHTMEMALYTGTYNSTNQTTAWADTGYSLEIVTSYPNAEVTVTLYNGSTAVDTATSNLGNWSTFLLSIDSADGAVYATPVKQFNSFIDFTLYDSQITEVLSWETPSNATISTIAHEDSGSGSAVRFSVVATEVFLETYGSILQDPSINVYDYFPQYESVRLNFYSFALYGSSITVNGITYTVEDAQITIEYVKSGDEYFIPSLYPNETVKTKTLELSNIYVTWDGDTGHCYLTFVNDRFTIDLGTYTAGSETVSFSGIWYFSTMLYEPYTTTETQLGEWKDMPDVNASTMILLFIGGLLIIGALLIATRKYTVIDLIIIGAAVLVGLMLLEF